MPRKIERHFPIKPGQPRGIGPFFIPFPNSLHKRSRAINRFGKNGMANFGRTGLIECDPEYSCQKKPKWTFPFDFRPKF